MMLRAVESQVSAEERAVADAVVRARRAQAAFAGTSLPHRARLLRRMRGAMLAHAESLIDVVIQESGKVRFEAISLELAPAALALTYFAAIGPRALTEVRVPRFLPLPRRATQRFRPRGVVGLITPFNYTLSLPMSTLAPALMAGNAIVWKPAETGARAAQCLVQAFEDAGLPRGLIEIIPGGAQVGAALVESEIDHLTFVGSTAVGRRIGARCGERLIPCILELGGHAHALVLEDADLDRASRAIVYGALANAGQSCISIERVLAVPSVFDELVARTAALADRIEIGTSTASVHPAQRAKVDAWRNDARARGAQFIGRAVVDVTDAGMPTDAPEVFGPVIPFVRVKDAYDAVTRANAHPQQLCAYVFGRKPREIAERLRAPHVVINDAMVSYAMMELPFGGTRAAGHGRVHGVEGLRALTDDQIIVEGHLPIAKEPWWLPSDDQLGDTLLRHLERGLRIVDTWRGT